MLLKFYFMGRTREAFLIQGIDHYAKRIKKYLPIDIVILKETKKPGAVKQDTKKLLGSLKKDDFFIMLDPAGKTMDSVELAAWLKKMTHAGGSRNLVFGLGGATGLDAEAGARADLKLSLSRMTFTHEMSRLILLEQIYRALRINAGHSYHK